MGGGAGNRMTSMFTKKDLDRSNIPVGEMREKHECPSDNKYYDIERGRIK